MKEITYKITTIMVSAAIILIIGTIIQSEKSRLFYALISSVVVSQQPKQLLKSSKDRLVGTIFGGVIGVIFSHLTLVTHNNIHIYLILIGLLVTVLVCELILKTPSATGGIVFLAIMFPIINKPPWEYGIFRTMDTCFGVIVSLVVDIALKKRFMSNEK